MKGTYEITMNDGRKCEVQGTPVRVPSHPQRQFFKFRDGCLWRVVDAQTGIAVTARWSCQGDARRQAIELLAQFTPEELAHKLECVAAGGDPLPVLKED